jgi:hypothetical protein
MGMNNCIDLKENGLFPKIAEYYYRNLDYDKVGSIWQWLASEYNAKRTYSVYAASDLIALQSFQVIFKDSAAMTLFTLRWL